jgi:hypothetical protein
MKKLNLKKTTLSRLNNTTLLEVRGGYLSDGICDDVNLPPKPETNADHANYGTCIAHSIQACGQFTDTCAPTE